MSVLQPNAQITLMEPAKKRILRKKMALGRRIDRTAQIVNRI